RRHVPVVVDEGQDAVGALLRQEHPGFGRALAEILDADDRARGPRRGGGKGGRASAKPTVGVRFRIYTQDVRKRLTRKAFVERTALAALGAAGAYEALDVLAGAPARAAIAAAPLPPEQHLLQGGRVIVDG